jgi:hypothetical protein
MYTVVSFHGQSDESAQELFANGLFATKFSKDWLESENLSVDAGYEYSLQWNEDCNGCQCLRCGNVLQT